MKKLTVSAYAKIVGKKPRTVGNNVQFGRLDLLPGVTSIDTMQMPSGKSMYIINFNPDYQNEK